MAGQVEVVLITAASFTDGRFKFRKDVPVRMTEQSAARYANHACFAVRTIPQAQRMHELESQTRGARATPVHETQSEEQAAVVKKKVKATAKPETEGE